MSENSRATTTIGPRTVPGLLAGAALAAPAALPALLGLPLPAAAQGPPAPVAAAWTGAGVALPAPPVTRPVGGLRHNPVFGVGPQTMWSGGIGTGLDHHLGRYRSTDGRTTEEEQELHAHVDYGITEDLTLRVAMPLVKSRTESTLVPGTGRTSESATGVGDVTVRAKYRFWHRFRGSTQYHAALVGGVELPAASSTSEPALGNGATDYTLGGAISRDGLRYYVWASGLARLNGSAFGRRPGNRYRYDAAVGWRPWVPSFTGVDPLLLLEFNGLTAERTAADGERLAGTGGTILAVAPAFWLTYRNFALKGGVKLPVHQEVGEEMMELDYALVTEIEIHM